MSTAILICRGRNLYLEAFFLLTQIWYCYYFKRTYSIHLHYRNESATKNHIMTLVKHWKKCKHESFSLLYMTMFILPTQIQWHLRTTVKRLALLDSRIWRTLKQIGWRFFSVFLCQLPTFSFLLLHDHQKTAEAVLYSMKRAS